MLMQKDVISTVKAPLSVLLFSFKPLPFSLWKMKEVEAQRCVSKGPCKYCPPSYSVWRPLCRNVSIPECRSVSYLNC